MNVIVANLGSTSFKFKLYRLDGDAEQVLAEGGIDRIGNPPSAWKITAGDQAAEGSADLADHDAAIVLTLEQLAKLGFDDIANQIDAVGFKAVHGGPISGAVRVDDEVIVTMERFADVAPAHNPPYIAAMRSFATRLPDAPQVAAFETGFHQTIPMKRQVYAIPWEWTEMGVRRYGFHGASHRYIAVRTGEILPSAKRVISLHLGGSCSICAINDGQSVANSFGMTAQSGVFHNNRVGDFDAFALLKLLAADIDLDTIWKRLGKEGGLLGISGVSSDMREVEDAAAEGDERAQLAVDAFVESCRHYVGAYLGVLHGADAIVFTGGIGQHGDAVRKAILDGFEYAGIKLDPTANDAATGKDEQRISSRDSKVEIWVVPTNEELIVARQTAEALEGMKKQTQNPG